MIIMILSHSQMFVCVWDTWDTLPNWSSGVWDVLESSFPEFAVAILPSFVWSVTSLRWPRSAVSQVENHCYPDPQWGCALALHGWRHGPSMVPLSSWNREQMISVLTDVLISKRWMKDLSTPCRIMSKINSNLSWPAGTSPSGSTVLTITRWHFFWTKSATFSRKNHPKTSGPNLSSSETSGGTDIHCSHDPCDPIKMMQSLFVLGRWFSDSWHETLNVLGCVRRVLGQSYPFGNPFRNGASGTWPTGMIFAHILLLLLSGLINSWWFTALAQAQVGGPARQVPFGCASEEWEVV
jgi:hypothetical protein